ncbi:hypothetical protein J2Z40_001317 [Cytobacillus eiseniae]|uniref:Lipoprotein n=1 Tax=Cytobacillus eiseniae TaxID=762947 RepID=A0ABS4RDF7_9BACI|nr:hypothetical protein [Cytobacillus eiseniae]MBP2240758.1 hypothetical protein [Cytobacillus eiseniae]
MNRSKRIFYFAIILYCLTLTGCSEARMNNNLEIVNSTILDTLDTFHDNELYLFKYLLIQVVEEEQPEKIEGMIELYLLNNNKTLPYILSLNNSNTIPAEDSTTLIELYEKLHKYINTLDFMLKNNTIKNDAKELEELIILTEKSRNKKILSEENMKKTKLLLTTLNKYVKK